MSEEERKGWKRAQEEKGRWRKEMEQGKSNSTAGSSFTSAKKQRLMINLKTELKETNVWEEWEAEYEVIK